MKGKLIGVGVLKDPEDSSKPYIVLLNLGALQPVRQPVSSEELLQLMNTLILKYTPELDISVK